MIENLKSDKKYPQKDIFFNLWDISTPKKPKQKILSIFYQQEFFFIKK